MVQAEYFSGFQKQFICNSFALYELEKDGVPTSLHVHATSGSKLCEISLQYSHCRPTAPTLPLCHTIQLMQHHVPHATPFNSCNTHSAGLHHPLCHYAVKSINQLTTLTAQAAIERLGAVRHLWHTPLKYVARLSLLSSQTVPIDIPAQSIFYVDDVVGRCGVGCCL